MTSSARIFQPLPRAPKAHVPTGLTADGAARAAWQPNVFQWVAVWRLLVVGEGIVALLVESGVAGLGTTLALELAAAYALVSVALAVRQPPARLRTIVLVVDLLACIALLGLAHDQTTFALMALYSYSTVISWASGRPIDAFVAGGIGAAAYTVLGLVGPYADTRPAAFGSNLALYFFFALATSGFFTVARRIGALEIATEISKERGRYRRDLHDRLGQALCGLHFELQAVHAGGVDTQAPARLRSLADGYRDARAMLRDLFRQNDEPLVATNVGSLIQQEARRMAQQSGANIDVHIEGDAARVPPFMRPHVWAIAGECTTNALKNGRATSIDVELSVTGGVLVLSVTDDGVGFDNPPGTITEKEGHYGLREMAERARLCGGEMVVASQPGFGTRVRLQVPLPEGGTDDLIERDASRLRENVWSLFTALRLGLGLVALVQLAADWASAPSRVVAAVIALVIALDVGLPTLRSQRLFARFARTPGIAYAVVAGYSVLLLVALLADVTPYFMLYAPLVLLAGAVHGGRSLATRMTIAFGVLVVLAFLGAAAGGATDGRDAQTTLLYVTNLLIIGMSATQGAKLLDRLEALQIRVRYQALARLRQGLSTRMRDQLMERLDALEATARELAGQTPTAQAFDTATERLERGSSELKARLREIVHQLADPTPGRT